MGWTWYGFVDAGFYEPWERSRRRSEGRPHLAFSCCFERVSKEIFCSALTFDTQREPGSGNIQRILWRQDIKASPTVASNNLQPAPLLRQTCLGIIFSIYQTNPYKEIFLVSWTIVEIICNVKYSQESKLINYWLKPFSIFFVIP